MLFSRLKCTPAPPLIYSIIFHCVVLRAVVPSETWSRVQTRTQAREWQLVAFLRSVIDAVVIRQTLHLSWLYHHVSPPRSLLQPLSILSSLFVPLSPGLSLWKCSWHNLRVKGTGSVLFLSSIRDIHIPSLYEAPDTRHSSSAGSIHLWVQV